MRACDPFAKRVGCITLDFFTRADAGAGKAARGAVAGTYRQHPLRDALSELVGAACRRLGLHFLHVVTPHGLALHFIRKNDARASLETRVVGTELARQIPHPHERWGRRSRQLKQRASRTLHNKR